MDGEATSWIRRAKFSHTVCYRLSTSVNQEKTSGLKRIPLSSPSDLNSLVANTQDTQKPVGLVGCSSEIQINPFTNKKRSVSPSPQMSALPESFKEAKSDIKRFSTPHPTRMEVDKGKLSRKDSSEKVSFNPQPLRALGSLKIQEKAKHKKEKRSSKSFSYGGGSKVSAMDALEEYFIDTSKMTYGKKFAHGRHSQVYHGVYKGQDVALKITEASEDNEDKYLGARLEKQFTKEATILSRLSHPNVVKFVGVSTGNCIVTEYLQQGCLRSYLQQFKHKSLPLQTVIEFALDIARGMAYIHSRKIVHRDLKPENVLIDKDFKLKIADFGIACEEEYCFSLGADTGTYRWMAPEVLRKKPHGRKSDVYSFGLVLWEMIAGAVPHEEMNPHQAAFAVIHKNIRPVIPKDCPRAMKELIEQCWSEHTDKRPEFSQIMKVLEQFDKSLKTEGKLGLTPSQICPELKKGLKYWIQIFGSIHPHHHHHHHHSSTNTIGSAIPKPKFS